MTDLSGLVEVIEQGAPGEDLAAYPLPASYRAAVVRRYEQQMFEGMDSADKDPHIVFEHPGRQTMAASVSWPARPAPW